MWINDNKFGDLTLAAVKQADLLTDTHLVLHT